MSAEIKNLVLTNQIFVCIGQAITGPVSFDEAKVWAEANWSRSDAFIWCEGFPSWVSVTTFPQLKPQPKPQVVTVNQLSSLKPAANILEEQTVTSYTNPGYNQPWNYPTNETTQVTRVTQTNATVQPQPQTQQPVQTYQPVQTQVPVQPHAPVQTQQPVQTHVPVQAHAPVQTQQPVTTHAPVQTQYQPQPTVQPQPQTTVGRFQTTHATGTTAHQSPPPYQAPNNEITQSGATNPLRATKTTPPKTSLPERPRRLPNVEAIQINPVILKGVLSRASQIGGVFVVLLVIYLGATKLPLREYLNQIQQHANRPPAPQASPEAKVAEQKAPPAVQPKRPLETNRQAENVVGRTLSRMVAMDSPVDRAAKSRAFQRNFDSISPDGKFWKENVPLGIKLNQLQGALTECQIERPEGAAGFWPLTSYDPPIRDFFPLREGVYKGLSIYFGWVGGLASRHAEHFEMRCNGEETFDLFFNKTSKTLFAYAKTITLSAPTSINAIEQVEVEMAKYCNSPVQQHKAVARDRRTGPIDVHVRYCQYADMVIVAASDAVATIQNNLAQVNLAYVSGKGWKEYISSVEKTEKRLPAGN